MDSRKDILVSVIIAVLGLFIFSVGYRVPAPLVPDTIGPRAFPMGIGIMLFLGGATLAIRRFRHRNAGGHYIVEAEGSEDDPRHPSSGLRGFALIALTFGYAALLLPLGYLLTTPPAVAGALALLGERRPLVVAATALIYTTATFLVFAVALGVRMPLGPLAPWLPL